ncbi:hypothetical protein GCM10022403_056770 [Streptomyces coacervatus]|uniref:Uncharacterized protein n=1 Tax=Streptomyces coacervatus TaxID=647381 RepID=A0ABP7IDU0_9ACTN|nr:hypothetical protein [Streptomyces coacervatus]MDF2268959.1 hypothetical protein [Streptomyces coacervatus]
MGERQSHGSPRGRRRVHPDGSVAGAEVGSAGPVLELLLAAAMREDALDAEGERRAVAAFRAARDAGVHGARTRRRDDWRPREQRRTRRSLKATLTMALASLTLGGVAVAAIGAVGSSHDGHKNGQAHPSAGASDKAAGPSASGTSGASGTRERPDTAKDTEAHCRAYDNVKGRGKAMDATAWQRLIAAAGGEKNVAAYCAQQLAQATATGNPGNGDKAAGKAGKTENPSNSGNSNGSGGSAGGSGNGQKADKATGKSN